MLRVFDRCDAVAHPMVGTAEWSDAWRVSAGAVPCIAPLCSAYSTTRMFELAVLLVRRRGSRDDAMEMQINFAINDSADTFH